MNVNYGSAPLERLKGWLTYCGYDPGTRAGVKHAANGYDDAKPQNGVQGNRWTATEYNSNNAWNCNFGNGNFNNNNKNNTMYVRPVAAYDIPKDFLLSVFAAFEDCCRNKRTSSECIAYTERANADIPVLSRELFTQTYQPGASTCFLVKYPKYREVFAAGFRDRIVHHWIYLQINHLFERLFAGQGNVSFNCRAGFGTLAAQNAAFEAIKAATDNYRQEAWVYRGDLVSFFMSIDKRILWNRLEAFIKQNYTGEYLAQVLYVTHTVVFHQPERDCVFNTNPDEWAQYIDDNKSLFGNDSCHGMPIGNLTTQIFANFYMSEFDVWAQWWFLEKGLVPYYIRFVDDFLVVCESKPMLKAFVGEAAEYLRANLGATLHKNKYHFQKASHGVKFVGAYVRNHRLYLANRTVARFAERIHGYADMFTNKECITFADLQRVQQVTNSYLGFCKGKRTYNIRKNLLLRFPSGFYKYLYIYGHYDCIKVKRAFRLSFS